MREFNQIFLITLWQPLDILIWKYLKAPQVPIYKSWFLRTPQSCLNLKGSDVYIKNLIMMSVPTFYPREEIICRYDITRKDNLSFTLFKLYGI